MLTAKTCTAKITPAAHVGFCRFSAFFGRFAVIRRKLPDFEKNFKKILAIFGVFIQMTDNLYINFYYLEIKNRDNFRFFPICLCPIVYIQSILTYGICKIVKIICLL